MKYIIKITIGFIIHCLTLTSVYALTVGGERPTYTDSGLDSAVDTAWGLILSKANTDLARYDNQTKLAKGFANTNVYSTNAASLDGYQDYNIFAIMTGIMISAQLPSYYVSTNDISKMRDKIEQDGDIYAGAGIGAGIINAGVNAGFIYPGLYINLKFGYLSLNGKSISSDLEGYNYKNIIAGIGINQIICWPRNIVPGILRWRGISIGTGFYYSKTDTDITINKSIITQDMGTYGTLVIDPTFSIKLQTITMTVPLEINTSIKFFQVINFNLGTGADFSYGSSEIKIKAAGSIYAADSSNTVIPPNTPGYVTIEGGTKKQKPTNINPKIISGLGFNIGIVKIDIPFTYYYLESGFAIGLSAGVVW